MCVGVVVCILVDDDLEVYWMVVGECDVFCGVYYFEAYEVEFGFCRCCDFDGDVD